MNFSIICLAYFLKMSRHKSKGISFPIFCSNLSHIYFCSKDISFSSSACSIVIDDTNFAISKSEPWFFLSSFIEIQPCFSASSLVPITSNFLSPVSHILGSLITYNRYCNNPYLYKFDIFAANEMQMVEHTFGKCLEERVEWTWGHEV